MTNDVHPQTGLFEFLAELEEKRIAYRLDRVRPDSLMVAIAVPGERWEVEFLADGTVEVERFKSDGGVEGYEALQELWSLAGS